jgi:lactoylglutathione lyase
MTLCRVVNHCGENTANSEFCRLGPTCLTDYFAPFCKNHREIREQVGFVTKAYQFAPKHLSFAVRAPKCCSGLRRMTMEYLHTMIRIGNIDTALDFWCNKLGLVEVRRMDSEKGRFTLIFLATPDHAKQAAENKTPLLELTYNWDEHDYTGGRNFGHLAYRVPNIYDTCADLMKKGVTINRPPRDGHMAFVKSPDGISIELLQAEGSLPSAEPWASMPNTGTW